MRDYDCCRSATQAREFDCAPCLAIFRLRATERRLRKALRLIEKLAMQCWIDNRTAIARSAHAALRRQRGKETP